jgi:hypothetical protein
MSQESRYPAPVIRSTNPNVISRPRNGLPESMDWAGSRPRFSLGMQRRHECFSREIKEIIVQQQLPRLQREEGYRHSPVLGLAFTRFRTADFLASWELIWGAGQYPSASDG